MTGRSLLAAVAAAACLAPTAAFSEGRPDPVECSAEDPCDPGVPCVDGICREGAEVECSGVEPCDPGVPCVDGVCQERGEEAGRGGRGATGEGGGLRGVHGFLGVSVGGGFSGFWSMDNGFAIEPAIVAAARAGVLVGAVEIALELAPYSLFLSLDGDVGLGLTATAGWLEQLAPRIYWPLRVGVGLTLVESPVDDGALLPALQLQADLVGLVIVHGHWLFQLSLPSVRYHPLWNAQRLWPPQDSASTGVLAKPDAGVFVFLFTFSVSYAF